MCSGAMSGVKCQPPDTPQPSESGWLMNPPQSPLCHCRWGDAVSSLPHLTSVHCVRCSAALGSLSPPRPRLLLLLTGEWKLWTPWVTSTPQLVILTPSPCSGMLTAMIWLHVDYDMIIWRDYDMRYEIWLHCPSVRHCGSVVSALLSAVHHTDATRHFYCTPPSPSPALYTRGWNVNHLQPFGCSALFMLSTLTSTLTPVIISSVDIQKV